MPKNKLMKKRLLPVFLFFSVVCVFAQTNDPVAHQSTQEEPYVVVEQMPEFPGGIPKLVEFLGENVKYPKKARRARVIGKVFASFVVGSDGAIRDVKIEKGIGYGCDEEVVRVVKAMPKWQPGILAGRPVPVRYSLPVNFMLAL
jgi:protein TonB